MLYGHYAGNDLLFPDFVQKEIKMIENWPTKKYNIIYADPPWDVWGNEV